MSSAELWLIRHLPDERSIELPGERLPADEA